MKLISQDLKKVMEECKVRARDAGLRFDDETLEYVVTNRDLIRLSSRIMIPTLYDYWVQDVHVLQGEGQYKLYPHNPYETVINSRPAISFYNDNNADWFNIAIFYHVLGHIDFFQNNTFYKHTWNDDFVGQALADKRLIAKLRSEKGRWVDYVIEFARGIDNLVNYHGTLADINFPREAQLPEKIDFYFGEFLQRIKEISQSEHLRELDRYNDLLGKSEDLVESLFFAEVHIKYPEFDALFEKHQEKERKPKDLMEFVMENSPFLNKKKNEWMKSVMQVVRNTSLYFEPQMRTKVFNEGWASYWHNKLFIEDERIKGHEVDYAKINAGVTALSRVGLNPYAIGLRLITYIKELADKGKLSYDFRKTQDIEERRKFDLKTGKGDEFIFRLRERFDDFNLINTFVDQDFVDRYKLFVVGTIPDHYRGVVEYYVKSRRVEDYKQMLIDHLYHPPYIKFKAVKKNNTLVLDHVFEGKQLIEEQIPNTLLGLEYLWGSPVLLRTTRLVWDDDTEETIEVGTRYLVKDRKIKIKEVGTQ